ncbi:MAG: antiviral reverse transcriptase Drt3a [Methylotenera sp.]
MLDQSLSAENFVKIFEDENRKGNDLASRFIPTVKEINNQIRNERNKLIKKKSGLSKPDKDVVRAKITELKKDKDTELNLYFEKLASEATLNTKENYKINLEKNTSIASKPVYLIKKDDAVSYFIIKQLQRNIRKLYKVKQSDRHQIVSQLSILLNNKFPKHLIRTDIQEFYETIPHDKLLEIIDHENLLSFTSKQYIKSILNEYRVLSASDKGLPRGVGVSAYLAELYMRDFDRKINCDDEVIYYARYVDDIVVLYAPKPDSNMSVKRAQIAKVAVENGLVINREKTKVFPQIKDKFKFDYLGYEFNFDSKNSKNIFLDMSQRKLEKYKNRIDRSFESYINATSKREKLARKTLISRIEFLTSNTKLYGNKNGTLIGIYFSNRLINIATHLIELDKHLITKVSQLNSLLIQAKFENLSFKKGFDNKTFHKYSTQAIQKIVKVWD